MNTPRTSAAFAGYYAPPYAHGTSDIEKAMTEMEVELITLRSNVTNLLDELLAAKIADTFDNPYDLAHYVTVAIDKFDKLHHDLMP